MNSVNNLQQKTARIAAYYARVSTAKQEEQETIESQLEELKTRINADGCLLPEENMFQDDGWTGETLSRPGLDTMRDAAHDGKFDVLYVYDRGRLSRLFAYQEIIIEELTNLGLEFVTLHDLQARTPEEHVLQAMQGVFHEYERVKIIERFRRGKLHKARTGVLINGQALYGYKYVKKIGKDDVSHIEVNEDEAGIVRKIFNWVGIERLSVYEVRRRLFQEHILPRKSRNPYWTRGPINRMLRTESYVTGTIYYNKSEAIVAKHPLNKEKYKKIKRTSRKMRPREEWIPYHVTPILQNNGLFERVQQILDYNLKYQPKNKKYDYLLSGLVWCECGERRVGDGYSKGGNHYYRCIERVKKFPLMEANCKAHGVNAVITDGLLWQNLRKFLTDKKELRSQAEIWLRDEMSKHTTVQVERQRLISRLQKTKEEELRYARAFGNGSIDEEQLKILTSELKKSVQADEVRLRELEKADYTDQVVDEDKINALCEESDRVLQSMFQQDKKKTVQDIIEKVVIYDKGEVSVRGHIPLFTQNMGYELTSRHSRIAKRGKKHAVQCPPQKAGSGCGAVSILYHRTQRRCRVGAGSPAFKAGGNHQSGRKNGQPAAARTGNCRVRGHRRTR